MSLQQLRARALSRTKEAIMRRQIVLDDALDKAATDARQRATDARNRLALYDLDKERAEPKDAPDDRYGAVPVDARRAALEETVSAAEQAVKMAEQDALAVSVHLVFKRIPPDEYQTLLFKHVAEDGEKLNLDTFKKALTELCYLRCESSDREDLDITWQQAQAYILSHGDREFLQNEVVTHNRQVVIHPS